MNYMLYCKLSNKSADQFHYSIVSAVLFLAFIMDYWPAIISDYLCNSWKWLSWTAGLPWLVNWYDWIVCAYQIIALSFTLPEGREEQPQLFLLAPVIGKFCLVHEAL